MPLNTPSPLRRLKNTLRNTGAETFIFPLLTAGFTALNLFLESGRRTLDIAAPYAGSFLLAGLPNNTVAWSMPLFDLFSAAALQAGAGPAPVFILLHLGLYTLVYAAGRLLGGYRSGVLALAGAGLLEASGLFTYDTEQSFYSLFLLLALALLLRREREDNAKNALLAGLAVGASLLARTPLFLFPPVLVLAELLSGRKGTTAMRRGLVFLAASYALLLPWGLLNLSVSGKFTLFDGGRAASNIISAARGSIYTMEGDSGRLAGLGEGDTAFRYYVRAAAKDPAAYALTTARRLWHIFLFYPWLFCLLALAFAASREKHKTAAFLLPAYFVLIHSLLSIDKRYFYPLLYLLPPLIAGGLLPRFYRQPPEPMPAAGNAVGFVLWPVLAAVLAAEALLLAYPARAGRNSADYGAFSGSLALFGGQKVFHEFGCARLRARGEDEGYYACLEDHSRRFGDRAKGYFLAAAKAGGPGDMPTGAGASLDLLIARMLLGFESGDQAAAEESFRAAYALYEEGWNGLRGTPYGRDRELEALIRLDGANFWNKHVYPALLLWPPENAARIIAGIKKSGRLTPRLAELGARLDGPLALGEFGGRLAREAQFAETAANALNLPYSFYHLPRAEDARLSKQVSDRASAALAAGDTRGARALLREALGLHAPNPEALMTLCALRGREGDPAGARDACRAAVYAVEAFPENRTPGLLRLAEAARRTGGGRAPGK